MLLSRSNQVSLVSFRIRASATQCSIQQSHRRFRGKKERVHRKERELMKTFYVTDIQQEFLNINGRLQ